MSLSGFIVFIVVIGFALISSFSKKKLPENPNLKHNNTDENQLKTGTSSDFDDLLSGLLKNSRVQSVNGEREYVWNDHTSMPEEPEIEEEYEDVEEEQKIQASNLKSSAINTENDKTYNSIFEKPSNASEWRKAIIMHEILKTKF